jgi:hypothetical protein
MRRQLFSEFSLSLLRCLWTRCRVQCAVGRRWAIWWLFNDEIYQSNLIHEYMLIFGVFCFHFRRLKQVEWTLSSTRLWMKEISYDCLWIETIQAKFGDYFDGKKMEFAWNIGDMVFRDTAQETTKTTCRPNDCNIVKLRSIA